MYVRTAADIGRLIRDARQRDGLSQAELATRLKTTQGWISEIENGKPTAHLGQVLDVLTMLGVRLDARLPGCTDGSSPASAESGGARKAGIDAALQRTRKRSRP